jgi:hypothetical protein
MDDEPHRWPFGKPHWTCEQRNRRFLFDLSVWEFVCLFFAIAAAVFFVETAWYVVAVIIGAWTIRSIVLAVNRQRDPRCAKRPPDAP